MKKPSSYEASWGQKTAWAERMTRRSSAEDTRLLELRHGGGSEFMKKMRFLELAGLPDPDYVPLPWKRCVEIWRRRPGHCCVDNSVFTLLFVSPT